MEEQKQELPKQERFYKPRGVNAEKAPEEKVEEVNATPTENEGEKKKPDKTVITMIAIGGLFLIVIIIMVIVSGVNKAKQKAAEQAALEAELAMQETDVFDEIEYVFSYTEEEKDRLREAGYTAQEIEDMEFFEEDFETAIKEAKEARQALYEKEIAPYFNSASAEFKDLYARTWVGQEEIELGTNPDEWNYYTETVNVDYDKIGATGMQCYIRVVFPTNEVAFMYIDPLRYIELAPSGNMVLDVNYLIMENGEKVMLKMNEIIP